MNTATIPRGFIRLHCAGSGSEWIVRVDSIAAYGPTWRPNEFDEIGLCGAVPVQLRGQPKGEATFVTESMKDIARMCMAETDPDNSSRVDRLANHVRALLIAAGSYSPEHEPL